MRLTEADSIDRLDFGALGRTPPCGGRFAITKIGSVCCDLRSRATKVAFGDHVALPQTPAVP
jgi:hypothetical protein